MTALPGKPAANATPANESGVESLLVSSPGARLQKGREAAKLSVVQAAEALHLSAGVVKALEADDYRALPNATFVKGYIRSYARLVGIGGEELVRSYEAITGCGQPKPVQPVQAPRTSPRFGAPALLSVAVVVLLLGVVVFWPSAKDDAPVAVAVDEPAAVVEQSQDAVTVLEDDLEALAQGSQEPDLESDPELAAAEADNAAAAVTEDASEVITEESVTPSVELEPEASLPQPVLVSNSEPILSESVATQPLAQSPVVTDTEMAGPADGMLSMAFTGDCWVEVRDGSGELIYSNIKRHGDTLTLKGVPPFEAKLGNGNVVSLSYNGQPVSFHIPSHNVVRVRLGE